MISQIKQQGFTIVELLIVIVVIAILAALSYVGYTSITARANNSTAAATAKAVKDTAQNFNGAHGSWPANKAAFTSGIPSGGNASDAIAKLPSDITFAAVAGIGAATDPKTVAVVPHGSPATGFTITYRNFSNAGGTNGTPNASDSNIKTMTVGDVSGTAQTALTN